jgi:hypothetical protein
MIPPLIGDFFCSPLKKFIKGGGAGELRSPAIGDRTSAR